MGDLIRPQARDVPVAVSHRTLGGHQSHDRLAGRRPADAIAPEQADDLAVIDVHIHAMKDVALAVISVEIVDREAHAATWAPRYASCTAALARTSCGGPEAITRP